MEVSYDVHSEEQLGAHNQGAAHIGVVDVGSSAGAICHVSNCESEATALEGGSVQEARSNGICKT